MKTLWTIRRRLLAAVLCLCMILSAFTLMDTAYVMAEAPETSEETVLSPEKKAEEAQGEAHEEVHDQTQGEAHKENEALPPTVDSEEKVSGESENAAEDAGLPEIVVSVPADSITGENAEDVTETENTSEDVSEPEDVTEIENTSEEVTEPEDETEIENTSEEVTEPEDETETETENTPEDVTEPESESKTENEAKGVKKLNTLRMRGGLSLISGTGDLSEGTGDLSEGTGDLSESTGDLSEGTGDLSESTGDCTGDLTPGTGDLTPPSTEETEEESDTHPEESPSEPPKETVPVEETRETEEEPNTQPEESLPEPSTETIPVQEQEEMVPPVGGHVAGVNMTEIPPSEEETESGGNVLSAVKTGDSSPFIPWAFSAIVSIFFLSGQWITRRRKKKE